MILWCEWNSMEQSRNIWSIKQFLMNHIHYQTKYLYCDSHSQIIRKVKQLGQPLWWFFFRSNIVKSTFDKKNWKNTNVHDIPNWPICNGMKWIESHLDVFHFYNLLIWIAIWIKHKNYTYYVFNENNNETLLLQCLWLLLEKEICQKKTNLRAII